MTKLLTSTQLDDLLAIAQPSGATVTLNGHEIPFEPVSVGRYLKYVVGRFEAPRAYFVMSAQVEAARVAIDKAIEEGRAPSPEDLALIDMETYLDKNATDQAAADAAFIACAIGHPGDVRKEEALLGLHHREFEIAYRKIAAASYGKDTPGFFGAVATSIAGRTMAALQQAAMASKSSEAPTAPRSSTLRGTGKKTPPKRRARATRKTG